jgi:hypothetical protein
MEAMRRAGPTTALMTSRANVDRRFDDLNQRVDRGFDKSEIEFHRINDRLDGMQRTMVHGFVAMTAAMMAGYAATIGLVLTQF